MPVQSSHAATSDTALRGSPAGNPGAESARSYIEVRNLTAAFDGKVVVKDVSFSVVSGEHLSLLGPSGCGKSTTLRCIAGLETPIGGEIIIDGVPVFSSERRINVPTEERKLSMVFQSYAIWPHMTVFENVAYGLRVQHVKDSELQQRVAETLKMVGMEDYIQRPATDLSGGQQQRVALARSYASRPKAILLDEPLSNLDARLRVRMREEIKELQHKFGLSTIYVTHDQEEAMAISDRIIVMKDGRVEQSGKPLGHLRYAAYALCRRLHRRRQHSRRHAARQCGVGRANLQGRRRAAGMRAGIAASAARRIRPQSGRRAHGLSRRYLATHRRVPINGPPRSAAGYCWAIS